MIIGIIGIGFVGGAIADYFSNYNCIVYKYDKFKNYDSFEKVLQSDLLFICVPTVYDKSKMEYDLVPLEENLELLAKNKYSNPILIKSTILPLTTNNMVKKYNLFLIHNPEFLSANTAAYDFANQKHIVLGFDNNSDNLNLNLNCNGNSYDINIVINFYKSFFPNSTISLCKSSESESMKIFCNSFYSVKIQFFNELYLLCSKIGIDYNIVKNLMLNNGWINPMHTNVPGTDGKLSYGGLCFPKDTNALLQMMIKEQVPCSVLNATIEERNVMRNDNDNIK